MTEMLDRADEMIFPEEVVAAGEQMAFADLGGKRPTAASIRLAGGKVALVEGTAFRKGAVIRGTFTAIVNDVGQKDAHDPKTGLVVSAEQRHTARIVDLTIEGDE